jgi:hypothetical protein
MASRKAKKAVKRVKDLPMAKARAKEVRGGAWNTFAKLGDIKGESIDDGHKDWIEIMKRG